MKLPTIKERGWYHWLYLIGAVIVQLGGIFQIVKTYTTRSAEDIAIWWLIALLLGELIHCPLSFSSKYGVWKIAHIIAVVLILLLLIGVVLYG